MIAECSSSPLRRATWYIYSFPYSMKYLPITLSAIALVGCSISPESELKKAELIECTVVVAGQNYINCYSGNNYYATNCNEIDEIGGRYGFRTYSCNYGDEYFVFSEPSQPPLKPVTWNTCMQIAKEAIEIDLWNGREHGAITWDLYYDDMHSICDRYSK